jgi:sec-independent protein translocase protein TatA
MGLDNPLHIALLVVVLLLVFGAKRLPEMGRSIGSGMREFKDSISGDSTATASQSALQQPQVVAQPPVAQTPSAQVPVVGQPAVVEHPAPAQAEPTHQA